MTPDIVGKLTAHLNKPMDDEASVVYFLVQVRKLLERDDRTRRYGALWMYCHWALHVDLHQPKTTLKFLTSIDIWITNTVAYLEPSGSWEFLDEYRLFRDFIFLDTFRQQLSEFLESYKMPLSFCHEDDWWYVFLAAYSGIIEDGTLSIKSDKEDAKLTAVKHVIFRKGKNLTEDHRVPFVIEWNIALKDGRTIRTSVKTVPGVEKMTAHSLEVINGSFVPPKIS
jgi:hypothetical protein